MNSARIELDSRLHPLLSPESVYLDLPVAGPGLRILAYGIDLIAILILIAGLASVLFLFLPIGTWIGHTLGSLVREFTQSARTGKSPDRVLQDTLALMIAIFVLVQYAIELGYFLFWEMITNGRSLGKILVGLRVVHQSGLPIDLRSSISRNVFRIIDMLPNNYVVGLVSMVLSASGERLGDHVAGTIVIRLDRLAPTVLFDDREARELLPLTREQQSRLGALEVQLIRTTLRRIDSLSEEQSDRVLVDVTETLCTRLEMPLPVGDRRTFLRALLDSSERYSRRG